MDSMIYTYRSRIDTNHMILEEYAELFNEMQHALYAEVAKGKTSASCKNDFLIKFGVTARQFNACRVSLDGKIAACLSCKENALCNLKDQIACLDKKLISLEKQLSKKKKRIAQLLHQKKRRRIVLSNRLVQLEKDLEENRVNLCFGSKKLFRAQFALEENGYSSHEEWLKDWQESRKSEFFTLGSKDESAGNQTCTAYINEDGSLALRLRLPPALEAKHGKYLIIESVKFAYGHEAILASIKDPEGQAISYRFKKDKKGWTVFASTSLKKAEVVSKENIGVLGIDVNADHIACVETDRFGNLVRKEVFPWVTYGKSKDQRKALTAEVCKKLIELAKETKKPIVIEKLDFQKKKSSLKEQKKKYARMLSSFSYGLFFQILKAQGYKQGIFIHEVNSAYTSVIGLINYATRYGLSTHLAAALCIARRYQQLSESPNLSTRKISDGKGCHVTFVLPARNRTKHVFHFWAQVKRKVKTVLAAHFRAKYRSSGLLPLRQ